MANKRYDEEPALTGVILDTDIACISRSPYGVAAPFQKFTMAELKTYTGTSGLVSDELLYGAGGIIAQSSNLRWDEANQRFNIGTGHIFLGTKNAALGGTANQIQGLNSACVAGTTNITGSENSVTLGGTANITTGKNCAILGGSTNQAQGENAVALGGLENAAFGKNGWAAGRKAFSNHDAAMMIQLDEATAGAFVSTVSESFCVRSVNGIGFQTAAPNSGVTFGKDWSVRRVGTAVNANSGGQTIIAVTDTSVARTITLRTADTVDGRIYIIKDESGGATTNSITIDTEGAATIDGAATLTIAVDYDFRKVYSNGTNWFTF